MKRIVKMYDSFNNNDQIVFPWDDESINNQDHDELYFILKNASEDILEIIGFEYDDEWVKLVNKLADKNADFENSLNDVNVFLSNFDVEKLNDLLSAK